jgi:hypothetical protein
MVFKDCRNLPLAFIRVSSFIKYDKENFDAGDDCQTDCGQTNLYLEWKGTTIMYHLIVDASQNTYFKWAQELQA